MKFFSLKVFLLLFCVIIFFYIGDKNALYERIQPLVKVFSFMNYDVKLEWADSLCM